MFVSQKMLREPRLLVPRMVPLGPIAPVMEHPLVAGASWAYVFRPDLRVGSLFFGRPSISIATARQLTPSTLAEPRVDAGNPGYGGSSSTDGAITRNASCPMFATSNGEYTGSFSLLVVASTKAIATSQLAVSSRYPGSPYQAVYFRLNAYVNNGGQTTNTESGTVYFGTLSTSSTYGTQNNRGIGATNRIDGKLHAWLGIRTTANVFYLYEDGQLLGSYDAGVDGFSSPCACCQAASGFALGGFAQTGYATGMREALHLVAEWDRGLTDTEARSITTDPFQMIRPA